MITHKVKLKDLTQSYFKRLKEQYLDGDTEIEIIVHTKEDQFHPDHEMDEQAFWNIIESISPTALEENELELATQLLSTKKEAEIKTFYDILSEKLYLLDRKDIATNIGICSYGNEDDFSADLFLYARCAAIIQGREKFEAILNTPEKMIKDHFFEPLLLLPERAYFQKTGKPLNHIPSFNFETFFNSQGWNRSAAMF